MAETTTLAAALAGASRTFEADAAVESVTYALDSGKFAGVFRAPGTNAAVLLSIETDADVANFRLVNRKAVKPLPFSCRCGVMTFATEDEASVRVESGIGTFPLRCPICRTGAADHVGNFAGDPGDERCYDCDGRPHSHGGR